MQNKKNYKHLDTITALFVAILLISNIASAKIMDLGILSIDGGVIIFPLSYIFGDILTEVYGYKRSRKVIWLGFISALIMSVSLMIVGALPPDAQWGLQDAYNSILGLTPRIVAASLLAFFAGEFSNSFILAKMKILTKGKMLWTRTIGSTLIGELIDTIVFIFIAFYGIFPDSLIIELIIANYIVKTAVEIILTPVTYKIVRWLKTQEEEDYYDTDTNFSPFKFSSE